MAFGGTARITAIGSNLVRIDGITLSGSGSSSGTIGTAGSGADIILPASFPTSVGSSNPSSVGYLDCVEIRVSTIGDSLAMGTRIDVEKTRERPFLATLTSYEPTGGENSSA